MQFSRVPSLSNPDVVIRTTHSRAELTAANELVFRNYVADGFWSNDQQELTANKFLHSQNRTAFVVFERDEVVGTMSIISDSREGLPSDGVQTRLMRKLRSKGGKIAEVSAFAMNRSITSRRKLVLFLMSYVLQFSFYYACIDRMIASCKPEHADFYESVLCFSKVSEMTYYEYSRAFGYLISLDLVEAHGLLSDRYPADPATGRSLYNFLLCDPHPCHRYPAGPAERSRAVDWVGMGRSGRKVA